MLSRLFTLTWDNSIQVNNVRHRMLDSLSCECEGVHFANGRIALDSGVVFESKFEMEEQFKRIGRMTMQYREASS